MVEKDAIAGKEVVALPVVDRGPVAKDFSASVGAARPEGGCLSLGHVLYLTKHFAAGGLVETGLHSRLSDSLEEANRTYTGDIGGVLWNIEADPDVALRS